MHFGVLVALENETSYLEEREVLVAAEKKSGISHGVIRACVWRRVLDPADGRPEWCVSTHHDRPKSRPEFRHLLLARLLKKYLLKCFFKKGGD